MRPAAAEPDVRVGVPGEVERVRVAAAHHPLFGQSVTVPPAYG